MACNFIPKALERRKDKLFVFNEDIEIVPIDRLRAAARSWHATQSAEASVISPGVCGS